MPEYEMTIVMNVTADNQTHAADIVKEMFQEICPLDFTEEVDGNLFAEMGIAYD